MSDDDTVTLRNPEDGARLRGGPADVRAAPGDDVDVPARWADYYVETHGFERVDGGGSEGDDSDEDETDDTATVTLDGEEREITSLTYRELQAVAEEHDDVAGNQSASDLRDALREKVA